MPIYEYKCEECGHELEEMQKFSDDPLTKCPKCGKEALKKVISLSAFHLKGSGWYKKPNTIKLKKQEAPEGD